ncbi:MAG: mechanosensitive ion channel [Anaerolineae bacterium]|nr:mechanosensitive ion channel [Anaerolineae bacterium]MCB9133347.1 mechanosensitive ion channel [Anaerolineales bacterium]MCB0228513.1 mechanosensitive ion channel [Anaerolineae bacterium]MCB0235348.1 mechanosensitive ion channel [Anaerolineae bacterium]MCB0243030.1 mechanosensitive ion channel [Anaerolineae bacterium]
MQQILSNIWSNDLFRELILTGLVLFGAFAAQRIFRWLVVSRLPDESPKIYGVRRIGSFIIGFIAAILILGIWVQRSTDLTVAIGILAAGLAFALQEIIGSIAGWVTIVSGQPFAIGDRIETGGIRGDVIDITVLRTKLMEIGNWLGGDHNTGRIVTVSNAYIFKEPLFNYSRHLEYVWDEIVLPITYESDWQRAIDILAEAVASQPVYQDLLPRAVEQRRRTRREFAIKLTSLDPRVFVKLTDNWIELGLVYPVGNESRRTFRNTVSQEILRAFQAEGIEIASQTVAIVRLPQTSPDRNHSATED